MKQVIKKELGWFLKLSGIHRLYAIYFALSLIFVMSLADDNSLWVFIAAVVNLCNAARLLHRIPMKEDN